jgi:tetratricopeptide (TPR) repeat protein
MAYEFIPDLILVASAGGILWMFLRRVPDVVSDSDRPGQVSLDQHPVQPWYAQVWTHVKAAGTWVGSHVWKFVLDAKDFKQGQIMAAKFASVVRPPTERVLNIGQISSLRKADRQLREEDYSGAEETYLSVIKRHPHAYQAYEGLVKIYQHQHAYDEITEILRYLVKHNPRNDSYLAQLGAVLLTAKLYADAAAAYQRSVDINPLVAVRFANLGQAYQAVGNADLAEKNFAHALDLDPTNVQYLTMLVDLWVGDGQSEKAAGRLKHFLKMDPQNERVKARLAELTARPLQDLQDGDLPS